VESPRRLLGHKSDTAMRRYRELDSIRASRRYAAILDALVPDPDRPIPRRRRKET
jgi:hypothetical protein